MAFRRPLVVVINRPDVLAHFATHDWVASLTELNELNVSRMAISRARAVGTVIDVAPRVVAVSNVALTLRGKARAAVISVGHETFVSGTSAGVLHGLRSMPESPVVVTVREDRNAALPQWCRVARTSWIDEPRDVVDMDGLRVASPLRMLFSLARQFNQHRFERAAEDVWHRGLADPETAADYLAHIRRSGRTGVRRMEAWLQRAATQSRPSQSNLERRMLEAISRLGLASPQRQHPLVLPSGETIHLDIAWPDLRLAFEPGHSWWHGGDLGQRRDQARDHACAELGWAVHRFDEQQVAEPSLGSRIRAIYHARRAVLAGPPGSHRVSSR